MATKGPVDDVLQCGICNNLLNIPKSLPCLHMYCKGCIIQLVSSIQHEERNVNTYKCPTCKNSFPFPSNTDATTFTSQLPTNGIIDKIIKFKNLEESGTFCAPCQEVNQKQDAAKWCVDCAEGMCQECYKFHLRIKTSKFHQAINIKELSQNMSSILIQEKCTEHRHNIKDHYCMDHQQVCCYTCVATLHRACSQVRILEDVAKEFKLSSEFRKLEHNIEENIKITKENIIDKDSNMKTLAEEKNIIIGNIQSLRQSIIQHFDKVEQDFLKEFETFDREHLCRIRQTKEAFESCREVLSNCKRIWKTLETYSSDVNTFLEKDIINQKIKEQEAILTELTSNPCKVKYDVRLIPEIVNLISTIQTLGTVECVKLTNVQQNVGCFSNTATTPLSLRNLTPTEIVTFSTDKCYAESFQGIELSCSGSILITNIDHSFVYVLNGQGELQGELELPNGYPFDVTMISDSVAAITYDAMVSDYEDANQHYDEPLCGVCTVDITTMRIKKQCIIKGSDYKDGVGITSLDDRMFVAARDSISVINVKGKLLKEIKTPTRDSYSRYITAISSTRLCYTDAYDNSVVCIDMDGNVIYTYENDDLKDPWGITSDSFGAVFVACRKSNNVHEISPDGQLMKIILCDKDGILEPNAIFYDRQNNKLALTHSKSKISVYQMN